MTTLIERLQTEADLCRNEGADDIARLLDEAVAGLKQADARVAEKREHWKQAAEAMAQEADHKFTMDGTVAHWLRALVSKRA